MSQTVTLQLSVQEVNLLLAGLGQLPLGQSIDLFSKIKSDADQQLQVKPAND